MTPGAKALLAGTIFFATCGVALFAVTLAPPLGFLAGAGWMLVLVKAHEWEASMERRGPALAELARGVVISFPDPGTVADRGGPARIREDYRLNHRLHDLATLPCRYGCVEPVTCPYPHSECPHCLEARDAAGLIGRGDAGGR